jgi:DNA-3-methyladenine glycosylase
LRKKLKLNWYKQDDVVSVAQNLLGKVLCSNIDGKITKGIIVETEAYSGDNDKACHANGQKKTQRNKIMFEAGGHAYVYLCYGIHHLFNVVTNREGRADAVLVRALEPLEGIDIMLDRRKMKKVEKRLTAGPGVLTQAMGIKTIHYGARLNEDLIWIEDYEYPDLNVIATTRIGVDYAEEDALKPWRFYIQHSDWVSKY